MGPSFGSIAALGGLGRMERIVASNYFLLNGTKTFAMAIEQVVNSFRVLQAIISLLWGGCEFVQATDLIEEFVLPVWGVDPGSPEASGRAFPSGGGFRRKLPHRTHEQVFPRD